MVVGEDEAVERAGPQRLYGGFTVGWIAGEGNFAGRPQSARRLELHLVPIAGHGELFPLGLCPVTSKLEICIGYAGHEGRIGVRRTARGKKGLAQRIKRPKILNKRMEEGEVCQLYNSFPTPGLWYWELQS